MITLIEAYGNHSNRLFQNLHFEAFCMEHKIQYSNAVFQDMRQLYYSPADNLSLNYFNKFVIKNKFLSRKIKILNNIYTFEDKSNNKYDELLCLKKDIYVRGWSFRVWDLTKKFQDKFIEKYSLKPEYYNNNLLWKKIVEIDRNSYNIIGVHIRRGDYNQWMGGKYCFADNIYQLYINNLDMQLKNHSTRKNIFVMFSNENINLKSSEIFLHSKNPWFIDHHLMSHCDYLIGPPSTFTLWASYIGKKKYFHMLNESGNISLEEFSYCRG